MKCNYLQRNHVSPDAVFPSFLARKLFSRIICRRDEFGDAELSFLSLSLFLPLSLSGRDVEYYFIFIFFQIFGIRKIHLTSPKVFKGETEYKLRNHFSPESRSKIYQTN